MTSVLLSKVRSMRFVKQMFRDRGYNVDDTTLLTLFDPRQDLWQIQTFTHTGHKVVALFADCKAFGTSGQVVVSELDPPLQFTILKDRDVQTPVLPANNSSSKNTGTDYIKCLIKFAQEQKIQMLILVTDFMTPQASKLLKSSGIRITHFTYDETGIEHMATHITQPLHFKALTGAARDQYVIQNPRYEVELMRNSVDDALVKYYGMVIGDIIHIQDNDRQSGLMEEYGIVVEEVS